MRIILAQPHRGPRRAAAFVAVAAALAATTAVAQAPYGGLGGSISPQSQQSAQPALLLRLVATQTPKGETQVTVTFSGSAPRYAVMKNDGDKVTIAFEMTTRSPSATLQARGLLQRVDFEQNGPALLLNFTSAKPVRMIVSPAGDRAINLIFSSSTGVAPTTEARGPAPGSSLPHEVDPVPGQDGFEVVPLKYADVSEVVGLLTEGLSVKSNDGFTPEEPAFGSQGLGGAGPGGPPAPAPGAPGGAASEPLGESVDDSIAIDRRLNAIILKGSPERIARLKAEIAEIDVPVESVLLETMFVELDQSGAKNVGLDFTNSSGQVAVATFQTGGFIPQGFPTSHGLSSAQLQAAVYAQVQAGHGKIVSKPRIAAQSGSTAKIVTGDALPILTSIALSGVNAVSQQVQYVNVGVTLQIAPRVSDDGFVTSHVFCVVSSVTGTSQGYPTISQREAETSATVHDGETFVIGGLTQESEIASKIDLPGIGKVPILGPLLGQRTGTNAKTELYIVVTPHIIRRGEAAPPPPTE